jgi:hypothetical protein
MLGVTSRRVEEDLEKRFIESQGAETVRSHKRIDLIRFCYNA